MRQLAWPVNSFLGLVALTIASILFLRRSRTPFRAFLAPSWLRMGAVALLPLVVLPMEHPVRLESLLSDLAMILHSDRPIVRTAILCSGFGLMGVFLLETRRRNASSPPT